MRLFVACSLVFLCAACGGSSRAKLSENAPQKAFAAGLGRLETEPRATEIARHVMTAKRPAARRCVATRALGGSKATYAALVSRATLIRRAPTARSAVVSRIGTSDVNGFAQVLGVVGVHRGTSCRADWYRVQLPVLPNGTTGWIRPWAIKTFRVDTRIVVDLSARTLVVYRKNKPVMSTSVAVGAPSTPTPTGRFYVDERYVLPDASGPFGPYALGISAHSDALKSVWVQDGPIGIHGTNEPSSIGHAASHGCVRLENTLMRRLFPLAPAGTPVIVRA